MNRFTTLAVGSLLAAGLISASYAAAPGSRDANRAEKLEASDGKQAVAHIHGAGDNKDKIHGTATFTAVDNGVKITVHVMGLEPGKHGIHIHEKADLSDPKLQGAGGHFNPGGAEHKHGGPEDAKRHAGDLGNIEVDEKGHGMLTITSDMLAIDGKNGVIGHSIIIHAKPDDLKGQPAGNSGDRVAGGVIEAKHESESDKK